MIVNFRDGWLRVFFVDDIQSKKIPPDLEARLFRKLQMIDDAMTDQDLRVPPSNHFENCMAIWKDTVRFASTGNGGLSFGGTAARAKQPAYIWTTIVIGEVMNADYET